MNAAVREIKLNYLCSIVTSDVMCTKEIITKLLCVKRKSWLLADLLFPQEKSIKITLFGLSRDLGHLI